MWSLTQPTVGKLSSNQENWSYDERCIIKSTKQFYNQHCNLQETVPAYKLNQRWSISVDCKIGQADGTLIGKGPVGYNDERRIGHARGSKTCNFNFFETYSTMRTGLESGSYMAHSPNKSPYDGLMLTS